MCAASGEKKKTRHNLCPLFVCGGGGGGGCGVIGRKAGVADGRHWIRLLLLKLINI